MELKVKSLVLQLVEHLQSLNPTNGIEREEHIPVPNTNGRARNPTNGIESGVACEPHVLDARHISRVRNPTNGIESAIAVIIVAYVLEYLGIQQMELKV